MHEKLEAAARDILAVCNGIADDPRYEEIVAAAVLRLERLLREVS